MNFRSALVISVTAIALSAGGLTSTAKLYAQSLSDTTDGIIAFKHASGLSFDYPRSWKMHNLTDKETIFKASGEVAPNVEGEIAVSMTDVGAELTVQEFEKILNNAMFSRLEGLRKTPLEQRFAGTSGRLLAYSETLTFTMMKMPFFQEYLFIPAKNKIITFVLTGQQWQRAQLQGAWVNCLDSIDGPRSLITQAQACQPLKKTQPAYCDPYAGQCLKIQKPTASMTLNQKLAAVLPRREEERFLEIPWQTDLLAARELSSRVSKPMFVWIMDGNVLGAT